MKRSCTVYLTLVVSVAALLTDCDNRPRRYCVDANQNLVDDQDCEHADARYHWYYVQGYASAHNGTHMSGGSYIPPSGGYISRGSSNAGEAESGGTVRGGIGAAGEAASGHAGGAHGGGGGE